MAVLAAATLIAAAITNGFSTVANSNQPTSGADRRPSAQQLTAARASCSRQASSLAKSGPPILIDTRGPFALLLYVDGNIVSSCITGEGIRTFLGGGGAETSTESHLAAIGPGAENTISNRVYASIDGRVDSSVTQVTVVLGDGTRRRAELAKGWFEAWWPGREAPRSLLLTTSTQTITDPVPAPLNEPFRKRPLRLLGRVSKR